MLTSFSKTALGAACRTCVRDEDGGISVEFVVACGAIFGLGLAILNIFGEGAEGIASNTHSAFSEQKITLVSASST